MENIKLEYNKNMPSRLDVFISDVLKDKNISRSKAKKMISNGEVLVNNSQAKPSQKLISGDIVDVCFSVKIPPPIAQDTKLDIIYKDDFIAVINKPAGMLVHPSLKHEDNTIVNALKHHFPSLSSGEGEHRPGILHRLDKNTSGLLVIALDDNSHEYVKSQIMNKTMKRFYYAIVEGNTLDNEGEINLPIARGKKNRTVMRVDEDGRNATTKYKVILRFDKYSLVECELITGRTHQIRVHLSAVNHPVLGDNIYGNKKNEFGAKQNMLHAFKLQLIHPETHELVEFESEPDSEFMRVLDKLSKK